jgi:hypothetical protein
MLPMRGAPTAGLVGSAVAALSLIAPMAGGAVKPPTMKPVIGQPIAIPAKPLPGQRFTVAFKVTRSDTHAALLRGTMVCDPSVAGVVIPHAESFRAGTARLSFVIPTSAQGKQLKVHVTITVDRRSATRVATFQVAQLPSVSIADASVAEGNAGTTTLGFPVTLSSAYPAPVSVAYAAADGTATAASDYSAASGRLTFAPGETAKTIPVTVVGDTAVEQDETISLNLTDPVNATIADGTATGTITNDDVAPPANAGHYTGLTSQSYQLTLDVVGGGTQVANLTFTRVVLYAGGCSAAGLGRWAGVAWRLGNYSAPISPSGAFVFDNAFSYTSTELGPSNVTVHVTGQFSGSSASGTLSLGMKFNYQGVDQNCAANLTWTASM